MTPVLLWIQHLPVFVSIAEADSVWAYPTVLMLHTVGLGWLVGLNTVVNLRLLGVGKRVPFGSFEKLFPMMWWGFWLNLATGIILFCLDADHKAHQWIFYAKLGSVVLAMFLLTAERNYIGSDEFPKTDPVPVISVQWFSGWATPISPYTCETSRGSGRCARRSISSALRWSWESPASSTCVCSGFSTACRSARARNSCRGRWSVSR